MKIIIQYVHNEINDTLSIYTKEKLKKLLVINKYLKSATVYFKQLESTDTTGRICNIELSLPKSKIFATSIEHDFEVSVNKSISNLEGMLKNLKKAS